ncbi:MAG: hypothetical protein PHD76_14390 [Methylacidiphilales bacterium]|nr:hypothetical protein [Candidatus Methylacidiphilales bacterium]
MINPVTIQDLTHSVRENLTRFWGEMLEIESQDNGLVLALPLMLPDGLQVVVNVEYISPTQGILSDHGRILSRLMSEGLNIESESTGDLLDERLAVYELERDGFEIQKRISLPPQAIDLQIFGEALVSVAHLTYRHDPSSPEENVAARVVENIFQEHQLQPIRFAVLEGQLEKKIKVDYFLRGTRGLALQVVSRKKALLPYMEQWGWRWTDLKGKQPQLVRAMVYDADRQEMDDTALKIGKSVCDVFCPYHEAAQIEQAIEMAGLG